MISLWKINPTFGTLQAILLGQQTTAMKLLTTHLLHDKYIGNFTLNNAMTTEKKLINAVAKITGLEKTAGLLNT